MSDIVRAILRQRESQARKLTRVSPATWCRCHACRYGHNIQTFIPGEEVRYVENRVGRDPIPSLGSEGRIVSYTIAAGMKRQDIYVRIKLSKRNKVVIAFAPCELRPLHGQPK